MSLATELFAWFGWFLAVAIWIAIAFWPARVAGRKGHHDRRGLYAEV